MTSRAALPAAAVAGGSMSRAAELLRSPYLCNWDPAVAVALADWLDDEAGKAAAGTANVKAGAVAAALLTSFGVKPT